MTTDFRIKLVDEELTDPPRALENLNDYTFVNVLARIHGTPVGWVKMPVLKGQCSAAAIRKKILDNYSTQILMVLLQNTLASRSFNCAEGIFDALDFSPPESNQVFPLVTVAVCTRDRATNLKRCLHALNDLDYPALDLLVIDNAPSSEETATLLRDSFPNVRYVRENRPGLDWARNRAVMEAKGEIIAYTDDDVIVDRKWIAAIANIFVNCPEAMAISGLVIPYELETEAQQLFEIYGGFGRGFARTWSHAEYSNGKRRAPFGTGVFGTGANMAYRRRMFDLIGYFDPALDVGTVTNGGGDLEMFFRVLKEGYTLVYEPCAIVRHRHRTDIAQLKNQIRNNGIGFYSYLVRSSLAYPEDKLDLIRFGFWWFWWWSCRRFLKSFFFPSLFPRDIIRAELIGSIIGLTRYFQARRKVLNIAEESHVAEEKKLNGQSSKKKPFHRTTKGTAVRTLELDRPWAPIDDVFEFDSVNLYLSHNNRILGVIPIKNHGTPISVLQQQQSIVDHLGFKLLDGDERQNEPLDWAGAMVSLRQQFMPVAAEIEPMLPDNITVTIVVATYDRPNDLRQCLQSLTKQKTKRKVQVIVADNHPASGLTGPVVDEFPEILLVTEDRKGISFARNAGIVNSSGDIIVTTDDDVVAPEDWIETLTAPFVRSDVMVVTGNVLPYELTAPAQRLYESYGGLSRGFKKHEASSEWFERFKRDAVPTWRLGATANAAFRHTVFTHPKIGLFEEMLGAGTPTGCSEDTYLFYNVLKNGYTVIYEPDAYVWHKHRRDLPSLRRQIYNYSKGHVAYHILTFIRFRDIRAIFRIIYFLPRWHIAQLYNHFKSWIKRRPQRYSLKLILIEIAGNLSGPWALCRSWWKVRRGKV